MDTRYFEANKKNGSFTPVKSSKADPLKQYTSFSHGVFLRNAHGQEVITKPQSLTWRTLGGSVDLTFYSGPNQEEVTKNYQTSTVGLPAMQQYNTLGYHQCRWGYTGWADLQNVIADFDKFDIPLEYIWYVNFSILDGCCLTMDYLGSTSIICAVTVISTMSKPIGLMRRAGNSLTSYIKADVVLFLSLTLLFTFRTPTMLQMHEYFALC